MKHFRSFWKEISFLSLSTLLAGCASIMESVEYPKPMPLSLSGGQTKVMSDSKSDPNKVFGSYCAGGRQIKSLTFNFSFISPKNPKGWPVNEVSQYMKKLDIERQCLNRSVLYSFAQKPDCQTYYGNYVKDLRGQKLCAPGDRQSPVWFFMTDESSSKIEAVIRDIQPVSQSSSHVPTFIRTSSGKTYGFQTINDGSSSPDMISRSKEIFGQTARTTMQSELSVLLESFTLVEPAEFQKEAYDDSEEELSCKADDCSGKLLGLDENGNADVSEAISQKEQIWRRYISRFSKVKESSNPQDAQVNDVQISLDLNSFCRYGRNIQDLSSK